MDRCLGLVVCGGDFVCLHFVGLFCLFGFYFVTDSNDSNFHSCHGLYTLLSEAGVLTSTLKRT